LNAITTDETSTKKKPAAAKKEPHALLPRDVLSVIAKGVLCREKKLGSELKPKISDDESLRATIEDSTAFKITELDYVPHCAFSVILNSETQELVERATKEVGPYLEVYVFKRLKKFLIPKEDIVHFVKTEFESEERQQIFFTAATKHHSHSGVIEAFKSHVFDLVSTPKSDVKEALEFLEQSADNGFSLKSTTSKIHKRATAEKLMTQLIPQLQYLGLHSVPACELAGALQRFVPSAADIPPDETAANTVIQDLQQRVHGLEAELLQARDELQFHNSNTNVEAPQQRVTELEVTVGALEQLVRNLEAELQVTKYSWQETIKSYDNLARENDKLTNEVRGTENQSPPPPPDEFSKWIATDDDHDFGGYKRDEESSNYDF